jgi:hypothetical protein
MNSCNVQSKISSLAYQEMKLAYQALQANLTAERTTVVALQITLKDEKDLSYRLQLDNDVRKAALINMKKSCQVLQQKYEAAKEKCEAQQAANSSVQSNLEVKNKSLGKAMQQLQVKYVEQEEYHAAERTKAQNQLDAMTRQFSAMQLGKDPDGAS